MPAPSDGGRDHVSTAFANAEVVRVLLGAADIPIYTVDVAGRVTSWNRAAERRFGYKTEEIVGAPLQTLVPAEDLAKQQALWKRAFSGERIDPISGCPAWTELS